MSMQTKEARINLAIKAILTANKISVRLAAKTYNIPRTTLAARLTGRISQTEIRNAHHNLTLYEEESIIRCILDLNTRGFPPQISGIEDITNLLLSTRYTKRISKHWAYRLV
jgi:hypothetical protein